MAQYHPWLHKPVPVDLRLHRCAAALGLDLGPSGVAPDHQFGQETLFLRARLVLRRVHRLGPTVHLERVAWPLVAPSFCMSFCAPLPPAPTEHTHTHWARCVPGHRKVEGGGLSRK